VISRFGGGVFAPQQRRGVVAGPPGPAPVPGPAPGAGGAISFSDGGGVIIPHVQLVLIFWGTAWVQSPTVTIGQVTDATVSMLTTGYMNSLNQYRGVGSGTLRGTALAITQIGSAPANPPNPFSDGDVQGLITALFNAGMVPDPKSDTSLVYLVIMPTGLQIGGILGEHTYYSLNGVNAHYGWVTNPNTLDGITWVLSHELVESVTDPEGTAITGTGCNQGGWCEIGDVCTGNTVRVNGVLVQRYWSQFDNQCVVPTDKVVKEDKDNKETKDTKEHKDHKDNKEHKDQKDIKDRKELKEGAKEKDKDFKEKDRDLAKDSDLTPDLSSLWQRVEDLARQVDQLTQQAPAGRAFIRPEERPPVGEKALSET
jgi:hypothetical protein